MPTPVVSTRTPVLLMSTPVLYMSTVVSLVITEMSLSIAFRIAVSSAAPIIGVSSAELLSMSLVRNSLEEFWNRW